MFLQPCTFLLHVVSYARPIYSLQKRFTYTTLTNSLRSRPRFILECGVRPTMFPHPLSLSLLLSYSLSFSDIPFIQLAWHKCTRFAIGIWGLLFYTPPWSLKCIDDMEQAVVFVVCFYVEVDSIRPSFVQLRSLGLPLSWSHYYRLQNPFQLFLQKNHLALHWKTATRFTHSQTTYYCCHLLMKQKSVVGRRSLIWRGAPLTRMEWGQ